MKRERKGSKRDKSFNLEIVSAKDLTDSFEEAVRVANNDIVKTLKGPFRKTRYTNPIL